MNRTAVKACPFVLVFAWVFLAVGQPVAAEQIASSAADRPAAIVIAHRGASGMRPEHTLSAYELALVQGADFIELDLVATGDGVLISRHENALAMVELDAGGRIQIGEDGLPKVREATTDVAERAEFRERLSVKRVDGRLVGGWFSEDFSLAEIRTLKARERLPVLRPNNRIYDDREGVPTLEDVLSLVRRWEAATGSRPGLYIELKHPTHFLEEGVRLSGEPIGLDLSGLLIDALLTNDFTESTRVFVQCFEVWALLDFENRQRARHLDFPLIQLFGDVHNRHYRAVPRDLVFYGGRGDVSRYGELARLLGMHEGDPDLSYADLARPEVLAYMAARYADGIGPPRSNVLKVVMSSDGRSSVVTGAVEPLIQHARAAGLLIHPYTLRAELPFLFVHEGRPLSIGEEARMLIRAGVDGFFIDQPSEGRLAVDTVSGRTGFDL